MVQDITGAPPFSKDSRSNVTDVPAVVNRLPWVAAYRRHGWAQLHPIIPPVAKAAGGKAWQNGKVPGAQRADGTWHPINVQRAGVYEEIADPAAQLHHECRRAWAHGAGIGVLGRAFPAIDVDIVDEDEARVLRDMLRACFGTGCFLRVGRAPKFLMPFRLGDDALGLRKMSIATGNDGGSGGAIEVLASGQQWVMEGTHGGTGLPYTWLPFAGPGEAVGGAGGSGRPIVGRLPVLGLEALGALLRGMADVLGVARSIKLRVEHEEPPRPAHELAGPEDLCTAVMRAWRNGREVGRDTYVAVAHALIGASRGDLDWPGFALFSRWAARHPKANPAEDARVWRTIHETRLGVEWLIGQVPGVSGGQRAGWLVDLMVWRARLGEGETGETGHE